MAKTLLTRRVTILGLAQRHVEDGNSAPVYLVMDPRNTKSIKTPDGADGVLMDIPAVVRCALFGREDMTGPVKVTILIQQIGKNTFDAEMRSANLIRSVTTPLDTGGADNPGNPGGDTQDTATNIRRIK